MNDVNVTIKDIAHFPGRTQYTLVAEIPKQDAQSGIVIRELDGRVSLHKDSKVHPVIGQLMVKEVREHMAQVHLD